MNSEVKELKVDTWIKKKSLNSTNIILATETHLTHQAYLPNVHVI
jgi:hypothetical protein